MEMTETREGREELFELSEDELGEVSGGYWFYQVLNIDTKIATVNQINVAVGGHNVQSNTAVVLQG
jgi:hypothetical protein